MNGRWSYLYRAVDQRGYTIDFYLSSRRNTKSAYCILGKILNNVKQWQIPQVINDAQSIMHQHFHAMTTFITEQVSAMRFDRAKCFHDLSHGSIHTCTHIHGLGREPDFIDTDLLPVP